VTPEPCPNCEGNLIDTDGYPLPYCPECWPPCADCEADNHDDCYRPVKQVQTSETGWPLVVKCCCKGTVFEEAV
jgi:hypothetical protein